MDVFTKYIWAKPLNDKKAKTVLNGLIGIVNELKQKPQKLWVDHGKKFYNNLTQKWLDDNDILMYWTTHNEGRWVVPESLQESWRLKSNNKWQVMIKNLILWSKNLKEGQTMSGLKMIFGLQI